MDSIRPSPRATQTAASGLNLDTLPVVLQRTIAGFGDLADAKSWTETCWSMNEANAYAVLDICILTPEQLRGLVSALGRVQPELTRMHLTIDSIADVRLLTVFSRMTNLTLNCREAYTDLRRKDEGLVHDMAALVGHRNLQILTLENARVDAAAVTELRRIRKLSSLHFIDCLLTKEAVELIPGHLQSLTVSWSTLEDAHTAVFAEMNSLAGLRLTMAFRLSDACKRNIPGGVRELEISNSSLSSTDGLPCLPGLEQLSLSRANWLVSLKGMESAGRLKALRLDYTGIRDGELQTLSNLHNLEALDVTDCRLSDEAIRHLPGSLRRLALSGTDVTGAGLRALSRGLTHLDISHCARLDDSDLRALEDMHALEFLFVSIELGITDHGVQRLREALPRCVIEEVEPVFGASADSTRGERELSIPTPGADMELSDHFSDVD